MSQLDDFLNNTLPVQLQAEEELHNGDVAPRLDLWSHADPVTLFGAAGPCNSGWEDVSRTFGRVASWFSNCADYRFELLAAGVSGDLAYTVGYEHCTTSFNSGPPKARTLRVTHIYRREDGRWKIVHRHGDYPPVDQTGVPIARGEVIGQRASS